MPDGKIFISYRRSDSAAAAGRLYDYLETKLGADALFKDVDTIPYGKDFIEEIRSAIDASAIILVVIGRHFVTEERRLFKEDDYVRFEIAYSFQQNKMVIPILVNDAKMPTSSNFPKEIAKLITINGVELRNRRWKQDFEGFYEHLEKIYEVRQKAFIQAKQQRIEQKKKEELEKIKRKNETIKKLKEEQKKIRQERNKIQLNNFVKNFQRLIGEIYRPIVFKNFAKGLFGGIIILVLFVGVELYLYQPDKVVDVKKIKARLTDELNRVESDISYEVISKLDYINSIRMKVSAESSPEFRVLSDSIINIREQFRAETIRIRSLIDQITIKTVIDTAKVKHQILVLSRLDQNLTDFIEKADSIYAQEGDEKKHAEKKKLKKENEFGKIKNYIYSSLNNTKYLRDYYATLRSNKEKYSNAGIHPTNYANTLALAEKRNQIKKHRYNILCFKGIVECENRPTREDYRESRISLIRYSKDSNALTAYQRRELIDFLDKHGIE